MSSISNIDLKYEGKISDIPDITGKSWIDTVTSDRFFLAGEGNSSSEEVTGYSDWYVINGGYNYFKSKCLFNELLMAELYKEFKVKCLEFSLARVYYKSKL